MVADHTYTALANTAVETRNADSPDAKTIDASEFKAKCSKLMNDAAESGVGDDITRNDHPISRPVRYRKKPKSLFGVDRGRVDILGNIDEPLDVEWESATGQNQEEDHCSS